MHDISNVVGTQGVNLKGEKANVVSVDVQTDESWLLAAHDVEHITGYGELHSRYKKKKVYVCFLKEILYYDMKG